jgi:alpha-D-xyloside xylohydrolase
MLWSEKKQTLTLEKQLGSYKNQTAEYTMNIVWISGKENDTISQTIKYVGKKVIIKKRK